MVDNINNGYSKSTQGKFSKDEKTGSEQTTQSGPLGNKMESVLMNDVGPVALPKDIISLSGKKTKKRLSKRFLEVKFKPNASILDKRGMIAESLSSDPFDSWAVSTNRVDLKKKTDKYLDGYFTFRNLGIGLRCSVPGDEFEKKAREFVKNAWEFLPGDTVTRIGVRSLYFSEIYNFEKSLQKYRNRFLKLSDEELQMFGGDLVDLGFPLNFKTGNRRFNIMNGPMKKSQARGIFGEEEELPKIGVFVDVDYFESDFKYTVRQKNVFDLIKKGIAKADEINKLIWKLVS